MIRQDLDVHFHICQVHGLDHHCLRKFRLQKNRDIAYIVLSGGNVGV